MIFISRTLYKIEAILNKYVSMIRIVMILDDCSGRYGLIRLWTTFFVVRHSLILVHFGANIC